MFGVTVRYPVQFRWSDGTETYIASEAHHVATVVTCRHDDAQVAFESFQVAGCWKCMSARIWSRS